MPIDIADYAEQLLKLYESQAREHEGHLLDTKLQRYLDAHSSTRGAVLRQVQAAALYLPHVRGRVLDWGCMHAADACMVRMHLGKRGDIHGCDYFKPDTYPVFHQFARLQYRQLEHPYAIPYPDEHFDTVIADGVLEHVPNDHESLKELYRVLKRNGTLVVSCLPNALSYLECGARLLGLPHHLRSYSMRGIRAALLHTGFVPRLERHMQMVPTLSGLAQVESAPWLRRLVSALWPINALLERTWPLNRLSSNLFVIARKRSSIFWAPKQAA